MEKRFDDALMGRIDALVYNGSMVIMKWELYAWYGADRISKNVWRDLKTRISEAMKAAGQKQDDPTVYECFDGSIVVLHPDGVTTLSQRC